MNLPTDVANEALDKIGADFTLGDIEDGTKPAQALLRSYRQCLMQLLRAAHWNFARRQAPLVLLADATGQTPNVGSLVSNTQFIYAYQLPEDCMKVRFIPLDQIQNPGSPTGNIVPPNNTAPLTTGQSQPPLAYRRPRPALFDVGLEYNYPPPPGQISWEVQGVSPEGRTAIFTNVKQATAVYTSLVRYPSVWDPQFRAAFVAYLASEVAMSVIKDKKFALQVQAHQSQIAKQKIMAARATDGNEATTSTDHIPDWLKTRVTGGGANSGWGYGDCGAGMYYGNWDTLDMGGTAY